jgi:cysteine-rich repeat protein
MLNGARRTWRSLSGLLAFFACVACGDNASVPTPDGGTGGDGGGPTDECATVELGDVDLAYHLGLGLLLGVRYPLSINEPGTPSEQLRIELFDSFHALPPLEPGTVQLGVAPDDQLATCQHCVWSPLDWDGVSPVERVFIATEGTLELTAVTDPLGPEFAGTASGLVMREATWTAEGTAVVDGGRCLRIPDVAFDTRRSPGRACESAEDCANPFLEICSPRTGTCGPPECGGQWQGASCPAERPSCYRQYIDELGRGAEWGGCHVPCDFDPDSCPAGEECVHIGAHPNAGICKRVGVGEVGSACTLEDIGTSCVRGAICSTFDAVPPSWPRSEPGVCSMTCSYFEDDPGCPDGQSCTLLATCDPTAAGAGAGLGQPCGGDAELLQGCASNGEAFEGFCFAYRPTDPLICQESCFGDDGCEAGEFCALRFDSGLGACLPFPVCGDGVLGEINEVCDDGNTVSGDGCSADCQTPEPGPICNAAVALAADTSPTGNTEDGWDGMTASCQAGLARSDVYTFSPPGRGQLRLTVDSATIHTISLRTECVEPTSELSCGRSDGANEIVHQVTDPAADLTVLVGAASFIEHGPYTLHAEWTAEVCGDGHAVGGESCDDGNTVAGDGCSADCSTIEYDVFCVMAAELVLGTTTGEIGAQPHLYEGSCTFGNTGADRLYRYTAPSDGTLRVHLAAAGSTFTFFALSVFEGCGAPGVFDELACVPSFLGPSAFVEVPVTQGQTLSLLVEGMAPDQQGAFTLQTDLLPP